MGTLGGLSEAEARIAELERERDRQAELRDEWQALAQEFRGIAQRRSAERDCLAKRFAVLEEAAQELVYGDEQVLLGVKALHEALMACDQMEAADGT